MGWRHLRGSDQRRLAERENVTPNRTIRFGCRAEKNLASCITLSWKAEAECHSVTIGSQEHEPTKLVLKTVYMHGHRTSRASQGGLMHGSSSCSNLPISAEGDCKLPIALSSSSLSFFDLVWQRMRNAVAMSVSDLASTCKTWQNYSGKRRNTPTREGKVLAVVLSLTVVFTCTSAV